MFELMININRKLTSFRNREKALECAKELLENYNDKFEKTESALPHLFKAEYYISYDRDLKMAKDSVLKAIEYDDVCDWAQPCLDILLYGQADFDNGIKLLEKCKPELKESKYYLMLSQINVERGDFEEANKAIDKALSSSLNYDDYLINKSFIYLHEDANQKSIKPPLT
ncbi:hypothetical protein LNO10_20700 [Klebsiella variicola subsp. variicola]|nr:hypothetical protein [Klebsiella variicola subsp. variicola]